MMGIVFMRKSLNASLKGSANPTYSGAVSGVKGDYSPTLKYQNSPPRTQSPESGPGRLHVQVPAKGQH